MVVRVGIVGAGGSFGQFVFAPIVQKLIQLLGWMGAMWSLAVIAVASLPLLRLIRGSVTSLDGAVSRNTFGGVRTAVKDALADPNRRYVLEALASRETATATELAAELPVTRQAVSKHLAALNEAGLVVSRREGRETLYELTPGPLGVAMDWMAGVGAEWDARLAALRKHLRNRRS